MYVLKRMFDWSVYLYHYAQYCMAKFLIHIAFLHSMPIFIMMIFFIFSYIYQGQHWVDAFRSE